MAIKVSQAVIDEIKKRGMGASITHANSGSASAEFNEGAKRMYGNKIKSGTKPVGGSDPDSKVAKPKEPKSVPMPPSAKAAATRAAAPKKDAWKSEKTAGDRAGAVISKAMKSKDKAGFTGGSPPLERLVGNIQAGGKAKKGQPMTSKDLTNEAWKSGTRGYKNLQEYAKKNKGKIKS